MQIFTYYFIENNIYINIFKPDFIYFDLSMKKFSILVLAWSLVFPVFSLWSDFSPELEQAYNWAYSNEITTQTPIEKANMKWNITREELAKMISNYAINVLWKTLDTTKTCLFLDSNINPNLVSSVTKSCQLWLMWQWVTSFRPKDPVTRAEFWTVLSRTLRWDKNEWWSTYYENHLKALKTEWIMNKINTPTNKEIRWYVMLMMMRSVDEAAKIQGKTDTDDQIADVIKMLD